jgi:enoyl-CoA hydratase/carnithine racemase
MNARGDWNSSRAARLAIPTLTSQDRVFLTELAARSSASQIACAVALQVVEAGWQTDLEPGLRYEAEAFAKLMSSPSARDAVDGFLAKSTAASPRPVATSG